jgi:RNA polymerase sigma-70 factor (ECF subfamily)
MNDRLLIDRAKSGDGDAFRHIVETHKKSLFFLAYDLTGSAEDAEDLSQDVFLKAFRSFHRFKGESSLGTWLYRIAVNTFVDQTRKNSYKYEKKRQEMTEYVAAEAALPDSPGMSVPEAFTDAGQLKSQISRSLDNLTSRERSVFALRFYRQMSVRNVAQTLEVSEGTVKSLFSRAMKKMGKELTYFRLPGKKEVGK